MNNKIENTKQDTNMIDIKGLAMTDLFLTYENSTFNAWSRDQELAEAEQIRREREEEEVYNLIDRLKKRDSDCREAAELIERLWEGKE